MNEKRRIAAARAAMVHVLGLQPSDSVLVVGDRATREPAAAFTAAAAALGSPVQLHELAEAARPLTAVPDALLPLLSGRTVVVNALQARPEEVPFRIAWIQAIEATGRIRLGHCPGITAAMMEGGSLDVDYAEMRERGARLHAALRGAVWLRLTSPAGADLRLEVRERRFVDDLRATVESGCNLPCGELYCAPVETGADGLLVIDGTASCYGTPPAPLRFRLESGRVAGLDCADAGWADRIRARLAIDDDAAVVGELGIGINPGARLTGNMLEDEKALRTVHVAFGNNSDMPGGRNRSRNHEDYLVLRPTLTAERADGSEAALISDGEIVV